MVLRTNKSSRLTGKLLDAIGNIGHLHERILVEPTNVVLVEMIGDHNDSLTFELRWLPGMDEVA